METEPNWKHFFDAYCRSTVVYRPTIFYGSYCQAKKARAACISGATQLGISLSCLQSVLTRLFQIKKPDFKQDDGACQEHAQEKKRQGCENKLHDSLQ